MENMESWAKYAQTLAGGPLWSKTISANSQAFVDSLKDEGYTLAQIREILLYFVRQMVAVGMKIPEEGLFDLVQMALLDPVCRSTTPMPEAEADALASAAATQVEETPGLFDESED